MQYGYARVSTRDQNVDRQLDALRAFPLEERRIYTDYFTGASFERPRYLSLMRKLAPGDVMVVTSIDRLGRNYDEIIQQWRRLTHERHIDIVVLDMPLLDTRRETQGITGTLIADIVLELLSYVAHVERENIRQRQAEGIAAAHRRGVRFGRPRKERPGAYGEIVNLYGAGQLSRKEAACLLDVSVSTFDRWRKEDLLAGLTER